MLSNKKNKTAKSYFVTVTQKLVLDRVKLTERESASAFIRGTVCVENMT